MDVTYVKDNFVINLSDNIKTDSITLTGQAEYVGEDEILENPEIKSCYFPVLFVSLLIHMKITMKNLQIY